MNRARGGFEMAGFKSKTAWREKLQRPQEPKLVSVPPKMARFGKGKMLIPTPKLVDEIISKVPKGKLVTVGEIRAKLAHDHGADRSEEHTSELQSRFDLVCRLL